MSCPSSQNHYFWWLWSECSPLPIPNREVKPHIADDTALVCGKVGRRQFFIRESRKWFPFFIADDTASSALSEEWELFGPRLAEPQALLMCGKVCEGSPVDF